MTRENDGRAIVARNDAFNEAELSRPGESIALDAATTQVFHAETAIMRDAWSEIMRGTSVKFGAHGEVDPDVLRNAAQYAPTSRGISTTQRQALLQLSLSGQPVPNTYGMTQNALLHLADLMEVLGEQRRAGYAPLMRFGDYSAARKLSAHLVPARHLTVISEAVPHLIS